MSLTVREWRSGPHEDDKRPYCVIEHNRTYHSAIERFATLAEAEARAAELTAANDSPHLRWYRACHVRDCDR